MESIVSLFLPRDLVKHIIIDYVFMRCKKCRRFLAEHEEKDGACATCLYALCMHYTNNPWGFCRYRGELSDFHFDAPDDPVVFCKEHYATEEVDFWETELEEEIRKGRHLKGFCNCLQELKRKEKKNLLYSAKISDAAFKFKVAAHEMSLRNERQSALTCFGAGLAANYLLGKTCSAFKKRKKEEEIKIIKDKIKDHVGSKKRKL